MELKLSNKGLSEADARALTDRIKGVRHAAYELIIQAYQLGAWHALGYGSWDSYCATEFVPRGMLRIPREKRYEIVVAMTDAGMSTYEIGSALSLDPMTVLHDRRRSTCL
ncbi:hypothetical protein ACFWIB_42420 [Streptomyces sp. NPDC127051]|uniref:hypothetical protein n=1 Tax=Streptomyces sp. NPDC127051 TaxID=3347119 RepID=UPI00364BFC84